MTEQALFDYETAKFEFEMTLQNLRETSARLYSPKSIDLTKIGETEYNGDYTTNLIAKIEAQEKEYHEAQKAFLKAQSNYEKALTVLEYWERDYCYKRYVQSMSNQDIARAYKCPLENVFNVRKSILSKIACL